MRHPSPATGERGPSPATAPAPAAAASPSRLAGVETSAILELKCAKADGRGISPVTFRIAQKLQPTSDLSSVPNLMQFHSKEDTTNGCHT